MYFLDPWTCLELPGLAVDINRLNVVNMQNRQTVFTQVIDNGPVNISGKFEASILKTFREKVFLTRIDCIQIEKWPQNG